MHHKHQMYMLCQQYMHQPVMLQTHDHQVYQGIIEGVDSDHVYLLIPIHMNREDSRQFGYSPYYPPYYYPYYPYPRPGFQRLILPLAALTAISLLPFF